MYLLGMKDTATQTVLEGGEISLGNVYRRFCKKNMCGQPVFSPTNTGVTINWDGIYHLTATLVGTATAEGDVTIQLFENGVAIPDVISTQTITTAETELRTFVIDYYILVDSATILGNNSTIAKTITLENVGVDAEFTSVILNIEKVV